MCAGSVASQLYCFDDVLVAGAPAKVSGESLADVAIGHLALLLDDRLEGHEKARSAEAALQRVLLVECLLERVQLTAVEQSFEPLGERDLARHLGNPNGEKPAAPTKKSGNSKTDEKKEASLASTDFGVHEALNLLKALNIVQSRGK